MPNDRILTYACFVCEYKLHKTKKEQTRITVGGNLIDYLGNTSAWNKLWTLAAIAGAQFVPTHVMAIPAVAIPTQHMSPTIVTTSPIATAPRIEELRAYHLNLNRMNQLLNPDDVDER